MSKTLYDDLIPAVKRQLDVDKNRFPNLHRRIVRDIENAHFITDLPLGTACNLVGLVDASELKHDSFLLNVYEIFGR